MPPKRGGRRGTNPRGGRTGRQGRNLRVDDEASQHGERSGERQEQEIPPPGNQNPQNPVMADFMAALAAQTLYNENRRANNTK